ncbi:potassium transporter Trk, partial [Staphylococcus pseudintermedius]
DEYSDISTLAVVAETTDEAFMKSLGSLYFDHFIVVNGYIIHARTSTTLLLIENGVTKSTAKTQDV